VDSRKDVPFAVKSQVLETLDRQACETAKIWPFLVGTLKKIRSISRLTLGNKMGKKTNDKRTSHGIKTITG